MVVEEQKVERAEVVDLDLARRKKELLESIQKVLAEGKRPPTIIGAFGDMDGCIGLLEGDPIMPPEGGIYMKMYGCPYLLTGFPEKMMVENFGLPKAMVSSIPREVVAKNYPILLALAFLLVFRPKKFVHIARVYFNAIYANFIQKLNIQDTRYNKVSREIRRAVYAVLERRTPNDLLHRDSDIVAPKRELGELIANLTEFLCLFIEIDSAYRFPFQDVFGQIDKEDFRKNTPKALKEALLLMAERWNHQGLKDKPRFAAKVLIPLLYLSPTLKSWIKDVVLELNLEKIKMDENDWYFCLERQAYDYGGLNLEERMKLREKLDEKGKVIRLKIDMKQDGGMNVHI